MNLRRILFNLSDKILGSPIKNKIKNIHRFHNDSSLSGDAKALEHILNHARQTVPFYKNLQLDLNIESFPVVNKKIIKSNKENFISDIYEIDKLYSATTSGSTGEPFQFFFDKEKLKYRTLEVIYHNSWANYQIGDKHLLNAVGGKKSLLKLFLQNEILTNPLYLDGDWLEYQRKVLKTKKVTFYVGYASAIEEFSKYCQKKGDSPEEFHLKGIIAAAEKLHENTRLRTEKVFGCPVLSRYGALESGVMSQECPEEKKHHINIAHYNVEILDLNEDKSAKPRELGRVVITDLFSKAMPLIRYDIGDFAILSAKKCKCGRTSPIFERLEGRSVENAIDSRGNLVSWVAINDALWPYTEIKEFQFIQKGKIDYELNLVSPEIDSYIDKISKDFQAILGQDIKLSIKFVDRIDRLKSGKKPYIINEYKKLNQ